MGNFCKKKGPGICGQAGWSESYPENSMNLCFIYKSGQCRSQILMILMLVLHLYVVTIVRNDKRKRICCIVSTMKTMNIPALIVRQYTAYEYGWKYISKLFTTIPSEEGC